MRLPFIFILCLLLPALTWAKSAPVFYICAHPDDCFLFMSPNLYDDIAKDAQKVVIVYLTSGDAGLASHTDDATIPYPAVRERASLDATAWISDGGKEPTGAKQETAMVTVHGHSIDRVSYANTVSYFLRLPDGNMDGGGFARYGFQSMRKLHMGELKSVTPIDGQTAYEGWPDMVGVLAGILSRETESDANVTVHIAEPNIAINDHDHSDHTTGARGFLDAMAYLNDKHSSANRCYHLYKHIDYSIAEKPANLEGVALQNKSGSFAVLTATQRHFLDHHNWDAAHLPYLTRNYYTTATLPEDCDKQL